MIKRCVALAALAVALMAVPGTSWAEDTVKYKSRTMIDLSGSTIDGELTKPEGTYLNVRKLSKFSTMIRVRGNFAPELLTSHNEI